jgi:spermidine synthase
MPFFLRALFLGSGASALIYQTVWMRMLVRVFGGTIWATTTVVAVFMAGLALGALLAARSADTRPSLARWGHVELGIAGSAVFATAAIAGLPGVWGAWSEGLEPWLLVSMRVLLAALCLAAPTVLMGMTLPLLVAAWRVERALPLLYAINTLGAVVGALAVGFVLLAALGERGSIAVAVFLNAAAGWLALRAPPGAVPAETDLHEAEQLETVRAPRPVGLLTAAVVGFALLGLEIAWTRQLVFVVGSSTYAFSSMIAMYLTGIALGGLLAARRPSVGGATVAAALFLLAASVVFSMKLFAELALSRLDASYTYSPLTNASDLLGFIGASALVVVPPTILSGMVFPWLVAWTAGATGRGTGTVYAWNTLGGVVGALCSGFRLLPALGANGTVYALGLLLAIVAAIVALSERGLQQPLCAATAVVSVVAFAFASTDDVTRSVVARRFEAIGYRVVHHVETIDATVTVLHAGDNPDAAPSLALNSIMTSTVGEASQLLGHLPLAMQDNPTSALVICFGVGGTFASAAQHVDEVHTVELIAEVANAFPLFGGDPELLSARQNRLMIDDGRNYLLRTTKRYDAIVLDGAPLAAAHLSDRGVFLLWLPTQTWNSDVWSAIRGVADAFEHTAIIAPTGSGILVLAGHQALDLSLEHIGARMRSRPRVDPRFIAWTMMSLQPSKDLLVIDDAEVRRRASSFPPLTDDNPITEFPLGHLLAGEPVVTRGVDFFAADR